MEKYNEELLYCICSQQSDLIKAPANPWLYPSRSGEKVHVDFAGAFLGKIYLLNRCIFQVDRYNCNEQSVPFQLLRNIFASWGISEQLMLDNGPQFIAKEFEVFMKSTMPGETKRLVKTFKSAMKCTQTKSGYKLRFTDFYSHTDPPGLMWQPVKPQL